MVADGFGRFLDAFPPIASLSWSVSADALAGDVQRELGVAVPPTLRAMWRAVGAGTFGPDRDLCFFGAGAGPGERASLVEWNRRAFWREIYPPPLSGGPVFFAENPFGECVGFRYDGNRALAVLLVVDVFESFVLTDRFETLFEEVLVTRDAITDPVRLGAVTARLGPCPPGRHFAPIRSPLLGGTDDSDNFAIVTPDAHFERAVAAYRSSGAGESS